MTSSFQLPQLQRDITACLDALQAFLLARSEPALQQQGTSLQTKRQELAGRTLLSLTLSGQYSAGKSTIISALTGDNDIKISADVATDQVGTYSWRGIELWDTPGLYANRPDHDAKAEQALREADLVVYCLTTNLFDKVTACDFRRLAFERGYAGKIFLVINKLSMEDVSDIESYIVNLTNSINSTLVPHPLSTFPHAFIDAQDYRDGIATQNAKLTNFSRFEAFVDGLNAWVKQRGLLARLDPPIRLGRNTIEESQATLPEQPFEDNPDLFLLNQQLRIVQNEQGRTDGEVKRIKNAIVQKVQLLGEQLLGGVLGTDQPTAEKAFQDACEAINTEAFNELTRTLQTSYERLKAKLEEFAEQPFVADYYAAFDASSNASIPKGGTTRSGGGNNLLGKGAKTMGGIVSRNMTITGVKKGFFYGTKEVAGSGVHKIIYDGGKFFGKKFKPYEAVRLAKGVGNAMVVLGAALAIYEIYKTIYDDIERDKREKQLEKESSEFRADMVNLGNDMAAQLYAVYQREFDLPIIGDIRKSLTSARDEVLTQQSANKALVEGLAEYEKRLDELRTMLYQ